MYRIILLGGMLAILAAAATITSAFRTIKPEAPQQFVVSPEQVDPAILTTHLQKSRGEMVLP
jgi:hypothetical protein